jgi:hypothetical protein
MYRIKARRLRQRPPSVPKRSKASPAEANKRYQTDKNKINRRSDKPHNKLFNNTATNANHANHTSNTRNSNNMKRDTCKPKDQDYENNHNQKLPAKNKEPKGLWVGLEPFWAPWAPMNPPQGPRGPLEPPLVLPLSPLWPLGPCCYLLLSNVCCNKEGVVSWKCSKYTAERAAAREEAAGGGGTREQREAEGRRKSGRRHGKQTYTLLGVYNLGVTLGDKSI